MSLRIVVSGMLAGVPGQGGASWAVLQYVLGLRRLGHDIVFVEPAVPTAATRAYFERLVTRFDLQDRAALLDPATGACTGIDRRGLLDLAAGADLLLNISGLLADEELLAALDVRTFVDLDPAFTQLWCAADGLDVGFDRHNRFVTIGGRIGSDGCSVPTCGRDWIATLQPIVLEHWPVADRVEHCALTTVGHWRAYGSIEHDGVHYGQKAHTLRALMELPERTGARFALALGIHRDEWRDLAALSGRGWELLDPDTVARTPDAYAAFVRGSWAEFGLAKSGYATAKCGWFSDRSVCYLASGRPVLALDTGFAPDIPTGAGLLAFSTVDEAVAGVAELRGGYERHRRAARALAEDLFSSDRVLARLLGCL
ncbi:MAG: glycosyltransferase [Solirubrobacteraceae bacterium]